MAPCVSGRANYLGVVPMKPTRRDARSGGKPARPTPVRPTPRGVTGTVSDARLTRLRDRVATVYPSADSPFRERLGFCYVLSGRKILEHPDALLVHGSVQGDDKPRIQHAWIITEDGHIWEPTTNQLYGPIDFDQTFNPIVGAIYTSTDAARKMLQHKHFGPWHIKEGNET